MTSCRFVASDQPRVIPGRHADPCTCWGEPGCLPCPELHCVVCGRAHAKAACTGCLEAARSDLNAIGALCASLPAEAVEKGVQSEAAMLWGPAADPEAWRNVAMSAIRGRLCRCMSRRQLCPSLFGKTCPDAAYLEDNRDELHPEYVLGEWEQRWREFLDHPTDALITVEGAVAYLDMQIGYMADQLEPAFDEFAANLKACRGRLEDALHDGVREERGAPCVQCERPMVRTEDHWECRACHRRVTEAEYRFAVATAYRAHAARLTAADAAVRLGLKATQIRVWGARGYITKCGKDHEGITLYDVESIEAYSRMQPRQVG